MRALAYIIQVSPASLPGSLKVEEEGRREGQKRTMRKSQPSVAGVKVAGIKGCRRFPDLEKARKQNLPKISRKERNLDFPVRATSDIRPAEPQITDMFCFKPVSWRRQWQCTPCTGNVLLPGKSHGRRSLVGCSPWGQEE